MKIETGNLWDYEPIRWIVVPTNIGWNSRGYNVMGAGVALEASNRCFGLAREYGLYCKDNGVNTGSWAFEGASVRYILFPTKPLNEKSPHLSWRSKSTMELVRRSAEQMAAPDFFAGYRSPHEVVLPMVGCGYGGLSPDDVVPMLHDVLDDRFTLIVQ